MFTLRRVLLGCAFGLTLAIGGAGCDRSMSGASGSAKGAPSALTAATYPLRLRDDRGATVTIRAEPRRIVALLPSHTETLFALGVGARVVGVDDFSDYPPEAARLPRLGGLYDTRLEALLALDPDLILAPDSGGAAAKLEQSGLVVWAGSAVKFDDVFRVIAAIGKMVGRSAEATRLSERIHDDVAMVERRLVGKKPVSVYYEIDATPFAVGPESFVGVMLAKAGGANIIPEQLGDFPRISPEAVIAANPSVILGASLEEVSARPGWSAIAAVRSGRATKLPKDESKLVVCPGPRIAEGLRALARRLHPEVPQ